jgi:predicted metal-binding protein
MESKLTTLVFKKTPREIQEGLSFLVKKGKELGADRALTITTDKIVVDERVRVKCRYPPCPSYGTSLMCPPHSMNADETKKLLKLYKYAILLRVDVNPRDIAGLEAKKHKTYRPHTIKLHNIINQLEGIAFSQGFYLALGLKSGSCRLCSATSLHVECEALKTGKCKFPLKARPSIESIGIDVFATISRIGWEIFAVGELSDPSQIPCAGFHGLLLVF